MNKTAHKILRFIIRLVVNLIARVELVGFENVHPSHSFVVAANHIGRMDVAMVYYVLERPDIIVMIAEKYRKYAITRFLARLANGIFIDRYNADFTALRATMKRLQGGGVLAVTPEGTRSKSGTLIQAHPGGIYLAWKAGVPIIPVALTGTEDAVVKDRLTHFRRLHITVTAGQNFTLPTNAKGADRALLLQGYTDEVMCHIAALLPEKMRGVYAQHPRLKELLAGSK